MKCKKPTTTTQTNFFCKKYNPKPKLPQRIFAKSIRFRNTFSGSWNWCGCVLSSSIVRETNDTGRRRFNGANRQLSFNEIIDTSSDSSHNWTTAIDRRPTSKYPNMNFHRFTAYGNAWMGYEWRLFKWSPECATSSMNRLIFNSSLVVVHLTFILYLFSGCFAFEFNFNCVCLRLDLVVRA